MRDVAISEWWAADPDQRFWMEITDREDLGADLFAPTRDGSGRPYWGYELLTYVQAGDIISIGTRRSPVIVGWSQATGTYADGSVHASGGDTRWWKNWTTEDSSLTATRYRYVLPPGARHAQ
jgi:hypothetical protein